MAFKFLDAVTTTGASTAKAFSKIVKSHTVQVTVTGSPTAVTVDLEGSLDNITFFQLDTHPFNNGEIPSGKSMFHVINKPVRFVRLNLTKLTGGTAPTVTGLYEGFESRS